MEDYCSRKTRASTNNNCNTRRSVIKENKNN